MGAAIDTATWLGAVVLRERERALAAGAPRAPATTRWSRPAVAAALVHAAATLVVLLG